MEFENPIEIVPALKEVIEGKEVCVRFTCPKCKKEFMNVKADPNWPIPGARVTCDECGNEFILK